MFRKTGYSRPHTIHCGPEGIYVSCLGGGKDGTDGPPGIFIMDCETFEIIGQYEMDRGKQDKHYDFLWNLASEHGRVAKMQGVGFLNAGDHAKCSPVDGFHIDGIGAKSLGAAIGDMIGQ